MQSSANRPASSAARRIHVRDTATPVERIASPQDAARDAFERSVTARQTAVRVARRYGLLSQDARSHCWTA